MAIKKRLSDFSKDLIYLFGNDSQKVQSKSIKDKKAEGHPRIFKEAELLKIDINDYQETKLGYAPALPLLEKIVYPLIEDFSNPKIIELGPGTGRWSRHITKKLDGKENSELNLIDHSIWITDFLKNYFQKDAKIKVHDCNGITLPSYLKDSAFDLIFSSNTFVALGIYHHYSYSHDFFRVLNNGGYCIFDYIDINSGEGWEFLKKQVEERHDFYAYHSFDAVNKVWCGAGFNFVSKYDYGKSTYIIYKKL